MKLAEFDYHLPHELIAQNPMEKRDQSRLLVLHKNSDVLEHKVFNNIVDYIDAKDILVLNETKVIPARLYAHKETGAKIEVLLLKTVGKDTWEALVKPGKRCRIGDELLFSSDDIKAKVVDILDNGSRIIEFQYKGIWEQLLDKIGVMPLPPYIKHSTAPADRYQTVYANISGSVAAPTAGLHFTKELLDQLQQKGVKIAKVQLNVGLGTFRPVEAENIEDHQMHEEYYEISDETADMINKAKEDGGRVICVGTTSNRVLETVADDNGHLKGQAGYTRAYIYPGYKFKVVDGLITNFHLPKSSLLMLVSALAGKDNIMNAYHEAIENKYRFFSFGDAMIII